MAAAPRETRPEQRRPRAKPVTPVADLPANTAEPRPAGWPMTKVPPAGHRRGRSSPPTRPSTSPASSRAPRPPIGWRSKPSGRATGRAGPSPQPVSAAFIAAIDAREAAGDTVDNRLIAIQRAAIEDAARRQDRRDRVRFEADIAAVTRNKDGRVVAGSMSDAVPTKRPLDLPAHLAASDPNWLLVETDESVSLVRARRAAPPPLLAACAAQRPRRSPPTSRRPRQCRSAAAAGKCARRGRAVGPPAAPFDRRAERALAAFQICCPRSCARPDQSGLTQAADWAPCAPSRQR